MPFKKLFKSARKRVKKLIPKEIRPFVPYIAAAFGPAGLASSGIFSNPAVTKALIAGGTRFATDDEADLKDIGVTAALAAAPTALDQFAGPTGPDPKGIMGTLRKGARGVAQKAKDSPYLTMGAQAGTDAAVKQIELDQKALEEYEADLLSRGIKNKTARRNAIFNVFINAGYGDDEVNSMLDSYGYAVGGKVKKKETPSAGIMTIETDAEVNDDDGEEEMSMEEFVEMMKGGKDDEVSIDDSLSYAQQGLGMLQGDVKPMPMMRFADGGFGGITEAVERIEEKPKEFLVDKLKVTQQPGQSEMRAIIEAMYNDIDGVMPDDRKNEFYELYAPQMYRNGEMDKSEFEFIQTEILDKEKPEMKDGGSVTFEEFLDMRQKEDKQRSKDMLFKDYEEYKRREKIKEEKTMAKDGGIMNLGGKEMDLRSGGFVPIGKKERADDVPARLSKNEFVMTADAVRAAGGGSVNKGAKRMYDLMNNLEARV